MDVRRMKAVAGMVVVMAGCVGAAQAAPSQAEMDQVKAEVKAAAQHGPVDVALKDQAVLHLPAGEIFIPHDTALHLLHVMGNPGDDPSLVGMILPTAGDADWVMPVEFKDSGYVKDDDARDWKADELLDSYRKGTEQANKQRQDMGVPGLEILGWAQPPSYDAGRQRLVWAMKSREIGAPADAPLGVNYNTYALGRDGYFEMNLVTQLDELPQLRGVAEQQLAALEYKPGKRYQDFDAKTDHVAEYGLAALVVGVAAKKLGLIALLGAFLLKFAKVGLVGLAVLGGSVGRMFRRKPKAAPAGRRLDTPRAGSSFGGAGGAPAPASPSSPAAPAGPATLPPLDFDPPPTPRPGSDGGAGR